MYFDHYYCFANKEQAESELAWVMGEDGIYVDTLGEVFHIPENEDPESAIPVCLPGYHVNIRANRKYLPEQLKQYAVFPKTPWRVWA